MNDRQAGINMYRFCQKIFPFCRSITGEGVRQTLKAINDELNTVGAELEIYEVPTGTQAFDWTVPKEWKIRNAYIENSLGERVLDYKNNNLHVVGYSTPIDTWMDLEELKEYIFTLPDQPDLIPYVTSYYKERFGFCMSETQKNSLKRDKYHVVIDSELFQGVLNYAEIVIPGKLNREIFFSTYICHPSMANNECSGPALATELIKYLLQNKDKQYTYRFVFIPETIGSITYLSRDRNLQHLKTTMLAGFNLSCVGDNRDYSIVESIYGKTLADRVLKNILYFHTNDHYSDYSFLKRGSDERQYNAPGVDLPVVCFCRSKFDEYPEYHSSADNMSLVSVEGFQGSYDVMTQVIEALEYNKFYKIKVLCEPQLGKRGLYPTVSKKGEYDEVRPLQHFIAYADGKNDLVDISNRINVPISRLIPIVDKLIDNDLLGVISG